MTHDNLRPRIDFKAFPVVYFFFVANIKLTGLSSGIKPDKIEMSASKLTHKSRLPKNRGKLILTLIPTEDKISNDFLCMD